MKAKVACLVVAILATIGCAPSNPPQPASANSESSNETEDIEQKNSQIVSIDPPDCGSEETRKIVQDIFIKNRTNDSKDFTSTKICLDSSEDGMPPEKRSWFTSDDCMLLIDTAISENQKPSSTEINFPDHPSAKKVKDMREQDLKYLISFKQNLVVYEDAQFSFNSYLVKNEKRASDGNSNTCTVRVVPKITSQAAGFSLNSESSTTLNLTLYKLDENGERFYEYRFGG